MNKSIAMGLFLLTAIAGLFILSVSRTYNSPEELENRVYVSEFMVPLAASNSEISVKTMTSAGTFTIDLFVRDPILLKQANAKSLVRTIRLRYIIWSAEENHQSMILESTEAGEEVQELFRVDYKTRFMNSKLGDEESLDLMPKLHAFMTSFYKLALVKKDSLKKEDLDSELLQNLGYAGYLSKEHWQVFLKNAK